MKKTTIFSLILLSITCIAAIYIAIQTTQPPKIQLTKQERQYIQALSPIQMAVDPDWEPFEKLDNKGHYSGIAADYVDIIEKRLDIQFEIVPTADWGQSIEYSKAGKVTILPFLNRTEEREQWLTFTEPLIIDDNAIIGRYNTPYVKDLALEKDKTIALPEGTSVEERIRQDFPNLRIIITQSEKEAFEMVSKGQVNYTIRSLLIASYNIRQQGWFDLKVVGKIPGYTNYLGMGISKDETLLRNILNRAILSITEQERVDILNKHIPLRVETGNNNKLFITILTAVLAVTIALLVFSIVQAARTKRLAKKNKQIQEITTRYEVLSQLAGTYFWQLDTNGIVTYVSKEIKQVLGFEIEEILHTSYEKLHPQENEAQEFKQLINTLKAGQAIKNLEIIEKAKDGSTIWVKVSAMPILDEQNHIVGYRGSCTDIQLRKKLEQELFRTKEEIELAYYQAQIAPHFLYNALSALAMYCLTEPKKASALIVDLSFFLRKSFNFKSIKYLVTLQEELELIRAYTNIEKARFGNRFNIIYEIDSTVENYKLPPLMLQPLVENAINHGITKKIEGGTIILRATQIEDKIRFAICDDGVGISPQYIEQLQAIQVEEDVTTFERHGVGLKNIHTRLIKLYNSELIITLNSLGGTSVTFDIPITVQGDPAYVFSNSRR